LDSLLPVISSTMSQRPQAASHRSNVMLSSVDFSRHTKSRKSLCYRLYCPISGPWDLGLAFADRKFVTHPLNRLSTRTSRLLFPIISQLCCLCVCIVQPARFAALAFSSFAVSRHVSSWHVPQFLPDRDGRPSPVHIPLLFTTGKVAVSESGAATLFGRALLGYFSAPSVLPLRAGLC
jgi:hypothetical protein